MPTSWARVTEPPAGSVPKINTARATVFMLVVSLVVDRVRRRREFLFFAFAHLSEGVLLLLLLLLDHGLPPGEILCCLLAVRCQQRPPRQRDEVIPADRGAVRVQARDPVFLDDGADGVVRVQEIPPGDVGDVLWLPDPRALPRRIRIGPGSSHSLLVCDAHRRAQNGRPGGCRHERGVVGGRRACGEVSHLGCALVESQVAAVADDN